MNLPHKLKRKWPAILSKIKQSLFYSHCLSIYSLFRSNIFNVFLLQIQLQNVQWETSQGSVARHQWCSHWRSHPWNLIFYIEFIHCEQKGYFFFWTQLFILNRYPKWIQSYSRECWSSGEIKRCWYWCTICHQWNTIDQKRIGE